MPNFLSPRFSTLRRTLMASTQMTGIATTSRLNPSSSFTINNSNIILSHYHNLNPPTKLLHCFRPSVSASSLFAVILFVTRSYQQVPKDLFYWDLKEPFNLRRGWLLWTLIALACIALCLSRYAKMPNVEEKLRWYALLKCTNFSALCVFVCSGIIAPVAEEVLHSGFILASLTKWVPTPVSVGIYAFVSAIVHLDPSSFKVHFIIGLFQGISYVQTRNLLTPIAIHFLYNNALLSYYYMSK